MAYEHTGHAVHLLNYHLVWTPKYRRSVLDGPIAGRLRTLMSEIAAEHGWTVIELAVQPDHVHLFVRCRPTDSPHLVVRAMKGRTSRVLRQEFAVLRRRLPTLWTRSYCASTQRPTPDEIAAFIAAQPRS